MDNVEPIEKGYEAMTEESPFSPEEEEGVRQIALKRAPDALAKIEVRLSDSEAFVHLPRAAAAAFHLEQFTEAKVLAGKCFFWRLHFVKTGITEMQFTLGTQS